MTPLGTDTLLTWVRLVSGRAYRLAHTPLGFELVIQYESGASVKVYGSTTREVFDLARHLRGKVGV